MAGKSRQQVFRKFDKQCYLSLKDLVASIGPWLKLGCSGISVVFYSIKTAKRSKNKIVPLVSLKDQAIVIHMFNPNSHIS